MINASRHRNFCQICTSHKQICGNTAHIHVARQNKLHVVFGNRLFPHCHVNTRAVFCVFHRDKTAWNIGNIIAEQPIKRLIICRRYRQFFQIRAAFEHALLIIDKRAVKSDRRYISVVLECRFADIHHRDTVYGSRHHDIVQIAAVFRNGDAAVFNCIGKHFIVVYFPLGSEFNTLRKLPHTVFNQSVAVIPTDKRIAISDRRRQRVRRTVSYVKRLESFSAVCVKCNGKAHALPLCRKRHVAEICPCATFYLCFAVIPANKRVIITRRHGQGIFLPVCDDNIIQRHVGKAGIK